MSGNVGGPGVAHDSAPGAASPRVFISYAWSGREHQEWVRKLGERLRADGVDVVLDVWDLKQGQDKYSFMESSVLSPEVSRVLIVCDEAYASRADSRAGGVGVEAQLISQQVYESTSQTKFIPIVRASRNDGKPWLPAFLANRKYIDFSSLISPDAAYEELLRAVYEEPRYQKPPLGARPQFHERAPSVDPGRGSEAPIRPVDSTVQSAFISDLREDIRRLSDWASSIRQILQRKQDRLRGRGSILNTEKNLLPELPRLKAYPQRDPAYQPVRDLADLVRRANGQSILEHVVIGSLLLELNTLEPALLKALESLAKQHGAPLSL